MLMRVDEAGEAVEERDRFTAHPIESRADLPAIDVAEIHATADAITRLGVERLTVSDGVAFHSFGEETWTEATRRVHVSVERAPYRALLDLASFNTPLIERVANALRDVRGERDAPARIRLAAHVGAAFMPHLIGALPMQQWAAPHDGKGAWAANVPVAGEPPNWFRPSYRVRPLRAWLNLRAEAFGTIDGDLPEAVALLAPVHGRTLRILCRYRDAVYATTLDAGRVLAAAPAADWYPYGGGSFGAELVVDSATIVDTANVNGHTPDRVSGPGDREQARRSRAR